MADKKTTEKRPDAAEQIERAQPSPDDFDLGWEETDERPEPSPDDIARFHELDHREQQRKPKA